MDRAVSFYETFLGVKAEYRYADRWVSITDGLGRYNPTFDVENNIGRRRKMTKMLPYAADRARTLAPPVSDWDVCLVDGQRFDEVPNCASRNPITSDNIAFGPFTRHDINHQRERHPVRGQALLSSSR
jgi:hypothetical protein